MQSATLYRSGHSFLAKEYTFKLQSVKQGGKPGQEKRKTVAKGKLDLSQYCSHDAHPDAQDVTLQLEPKGKLNLNIKAVWLQHIKVDGTANSDADSVTDLSSHCTTTAASSEEHSPNWRRQQDLLTTSAFANQQAGNVSPPQNMSVPKHRRLASPSYLPDTIYEVPDREGMSPVNSLSNSMSINKSLPVERKLSLGDVTAGPAASEAPAGTNPSGGAVAAAAAAKLDQQQVTTSRSQELQQVTVLAQDHCWHSGAAELPWIDGHTHRNDIRSLCHVRVKCMHLDG